MDLENERPSAFHLENSQVKPRDLLGRIRELDLVARAWPSDDDQRIGEGEGVTMITVNFHGCCDYDYGCS